MQLEFGAGIFWGERTDASGSNTPDIFGIAQKVNIDFEFTNKELRGQGQFPVDIARAVGKVSGSVGFAQIFGNIYGDLFFGVTPTTAGLIVAANESQAVPTTPYQVTVTNSATFSLDLGVFYGSGANAGLRLARVASGPTAGQYSVSAGVYTFAAADTGITMLISYRYTRSTGKQIAITNQLQGVTPSWKGTFYNQKTTQNALKQMTVTLNACVSSKLSLPFSVDEYHIEQMDFEAFADATNAVATISVDE